MKVVLYKTYCFVFNIHVLKDSICPLKEMANILYFKQAMASFSGTTLFRFICGTWMDSKNTYYIRKLLFSIK